MVRPEECGWPRCNGRDYHSLYMYQSHPGSGTTPRGRFGTAAVLAKLPVTEISGVAGRRPG